jgi:hypothetical protein
MAQGEYALCKPRTGVSVTRTWNLVSRKHYKDKRAHRQNSSQSVAL